MARTAVFADKMEVVRVLDTLATKPARRGEAPASYFLMKKLVERGLVDYRKPQGEGRQHMTYSVSGKGRSYQALAKRWKKD